MKTIEARPAVAVLTMTHLIYKQKRSMDVHMKNNSINTHSAFAVGEMMCLWLHAFVVRRMHLWQLASDYLRSSLHICERDGIILFFTRALNSIRL